MKCPYCDSESNVLDSRASADGVRRRRTCPNCKRRFTTYEKLGPPNIKVVKRGSRANEPFTIDKLNALLKRVCKDRPNVSEADMRRIAVDIEAQVVDRGGRSITSGQVVAMVLDRLAVIDRLSYDRLAINYVGEDGQLRTEETAEVDSSQLGLFTPSGEDE